jgi:hypothetical protein
MIALTNIVRETVRLRARLSGFAVSRRIEAAIRSLVLNSEVEIVEYLQAYHPFCPVHGERPIDVGPHVWQAECDLCGAVLDTFQPRLEQVICVRSRVGPPHLRGAS